MKYCLYYRAKIEKELCWIVTSTLRYSEYLVFDRCYDKEQSIFEFFVAPDLQDVFVSIMATFEKHGIVSQLQFLPNRLLDENEQV
ncbi:hypothetical protein [Candidatus Chromulinivorax destructor]|uniref:DUF4911 domain-containing protein n=1 Tax=Candidatus Chromulinivorax destructor TaxID=2066483 RepID=A0A345ZB66_9BACT|nr:hypothetical protein [Candidatus Chromulinivorax destructor]AXK60533.1 hypothetical protein C0J27_02120 [Candidatus Chromulinivorax destructor]